MPHRLRPGRVKGSGESGRSAGTQGCLRPCAVLAGAVRQGSGDFSDQSGDRPDRYPSQAETSGRFSAPMTSSATSVPRAMPSFISIDATIFFTVFSQETSPG
jgi:hypothetical protein